MFLTAYFVLETWLQSRRLQMVYEQLSRLFLQSRFPMSIVFYRSAVLYCDTSPVTSEIDIHSVLKHKRNCVNLEGPLHIDYPLEFSSSVISKLCSNANKARIIDIFWSSLPSFRPVLSSTSHGVTLSPKQVVKLDTWIEYPMDSSDLLLPVHSDSIGQCTNYRIENTREFTLYILLEMHVEQICNKNNNFIRIEDFGQPIAWNTYDSQLGVILRTDLKQLSGLVLRSFMQNNLFVNDYLPLLHIASVDIDGQPIPVQQIRHSYVPGMFNFPDIHWRQYVNSMRKINALPTAINSVSPNTGQEGLDSLEDLNINASFDLIENIDLLRSDICKSPNQPEDSYNKDEDLNNCDKLSIKSTIPENDTKLVHQHRISPSNDSSTYQLPVNKPPNVLVYSESRASRDAVIKTLSALLSPDMYTIYPLNDLSVCSQIWIENTTMLVVCGSVKNSLGRILTEFFLRGGKMLSICSDVLQMVLPTFRSHAEIREHELVQFSYGRWTHIQMMHHIFCYQPSAVDNHFSNDSEAKNVFLQDESQLCLNKIGTNAVYSPTYSKTIDIEDMNKQIHRLHVQVLGTEETWNTPSLLLANDVYSDGKAILSQIHLEMDPSHYEHDYTKYTILKQNNTARLEIIRDLLVVHLGISCVPEGACFGQNDAMFGKAYFLGDYVAKSVMLENLKLSMEDNTIRTNELTLRFYGQHVNPTDATSTELPIMINSCPDDFSTIDYFENLHSSKIGRLAIYAPVMTSTMHVLSGLVPLSHGLAVITRRQTSGIGRSKNQWLSPDGCLMFSIQLHVPLDSILGQRLSLMQHLIAVAIVRAIKSFDGYEQLDIALKWPNDIYANKCTKIGGITINSQISALMAICNIGCGLNLSNSTPTLCINDMIRDYNAKNAIQNTNGNGHYLEPLGFERLLGVIFSEIESLFDTVQSGELQLLYKLYESLWLHSAAEVGIADKNGKVTKCKILGIDECGFLLVKRNELIESVQPDGNSFDMLRGLIMAK